MEEDRGQYIGLRRGLIEGGAVFYAPPKDVAEELTRQMEAIREIDMQEEQRCNHPPPKRQFAFTQGGAHYYRCEVCAVLLDEQGEPVNELKPPLHRNPPSIGPQRDPLADGLPTPAVIVEVGPHKWPTYPEIVQYEVGGDVIDYPPSKYTHPDEARSRRDGPCGKRYRVIVNDEPRYRAMVRAGWLKDRNAPSGQIIDHRRVSGS